jgi:hypothetical protein
LVPNRKIVRTKSKTLDILLPQLITIMSSSKYPLSGLLGARLAVFLIAGLFATAANGQSSPPETTAPSTIPEVSEQKALRSYIGVGGAFGLSGNTTSLSEGGVAIFGKGVLTENLSIDSTMIIFARSAPSSSVALTYNLPIETEGVPFSFISFVGAGAMIDNNSGTRVSPLLSAGVDLVTPTNFTGTIRLNAGFPGDREADVGLIFGVGFSY